MTQQRLGIGGHHRAYTDIRHDEWLTPPGIIEALGPFDLDPCAAVDQPWDTATTHFTIDDDGLAQPWHGFVWLNPPYGGRIGVWMRRLADHGDGLALVFARTETRWFVDQVWLCADAVAFIHGRIHFYDLRGQRSEANAGAPSCIIAYGADARSRLARLPLPHSIVRWNSP
jgi:hypothetical protein